MTEAIIVALIGAVGAIIVAIINKACNKKNIPSAKSDGKKITINQKIRGNNITQIGIQVNERKGEKDE